MRRHVHAAAAARKLVVMVALVTVLVAVGCDPTGPGHDPEAVAINNRGVALMGRFDYAAAREEFQKVLQLYPGQPDLLVNLAIATLNRQKDGDEELAMDSLEQALKADPGNLRAQYCKALLLMHMGQPAEAGEEFRKVFAADPTDADSAYFIGQSLMQQSSYEEALEWYRKAFEIDPYLRSAYYTAFQALQRLHRIDEARAMLQRFQSLDDNPRVRLVELKYTKMGRKADVLAIGSEQRTQAAKPEGAVLAAPEPLPVSGGDGAAWASRAGHMTAADMNGDGLVDLFIAGGLAADDAAGPETASGPETIGTPRNAVLLARDDGGYDLQTSHPLASIPEVNAALWGDLDNDGLVDVYLCRRGANQLWRQLEGGAWQDVTETTGTAGGELDTVDGAMLDADHDGDLDLLLANRDGDDELLNNDRNGSFRPLAAELGLGGGASAARSVIAADLDHDGDVDLVVLNERPPHHVWINELMWSYKPAQTWQGLAKAELLAAVAADRDADGQVEIYGMTPQGGLSMWTADSGAGEGVTTVSLSSAVSLSPVPLSSPVFVPRLAVADLDGDGLLEILGSGPGGWWVAPGGAGTGGSAGGDLPYLGGEGPGVWSSWTLVLESPGKGPSLVGRPADGAPVRLGPGPGRFGFLALSLTGKEDTAASMRTNASGIGTMVEMRTGSRWTVTSTFRSDSGPGQSLQPLALGLGGAPQADFVSLDWSDGVLQTELDLEPGQVHRIAEVQRQLSSCPVLFAWDGERFAFVSDMLGVGGIGYALGPPGAYSEPRPRESFMIADGVARPRDGRIVLKLTEPMEEITYLDAARLVAYDLPPGWSMTLDERMGINGPEPTGRPVFYRESRLARVAIDETGRDVTGSVARADLEAAPVGAIDGRFIGRLAGEHVLTLDFGTAIDDGPGRPVLVADGWVEYPYSQTNFAAWQAGADYVAPTLEALGLDGRWKAVLQQLGYPAGMPRQMSLPLPALPAGTTKLRLRTNQEIYWDRVAVAYEEPCPQVVVQELPLVEARLARTGFARRIEHAQRRPDYDYDHRAPVWDVRFMEGDYTRLGPVLELVRSGDDAVAIFGPGEEIQLELQAPVGSPPEGWTRALVLQLEGWCKDMDMYTKDGRTVGPLPTSGRGGPEREQLHQKYNTRFQWGRD